VSPTTRRWTERLLLLMILLVLSALGWRLMSPRRSLDARFEFAQPNLDEVVVTIAGRPHAITELDHHPEAITRKVSFEYSTDSHGFRGREVQEQKPPGTFRIAAVGECVTLGVGVNDDEFWARLLEGMLRERYPERPIEVLVTGRISPPSQIVNHLLQDLPPFSPDLVLLALGSDTVFQGCHTGRDPFQLYLPPTQYEDLLREYRQQLTRAADDAETQGYRLVLVTPTINSFFLPDGQRWVDEMKRFAAERRIPVLDTASLFQQVEREQGLVLETTGDQQRLVSYRGGEPLILAQSPVSTTSHIAPSLLRYLDEHHEVGPHLSIDGNHPNAQGHRLIATEAFSLVQQHGWLEQREPGG
jgi:lysophospholipase L1-like esterase